MKSRVQSLFLLVPVLVRHTIFKITCSMNRKINRVWFLVVLFSVPLHHNLSSPSTSCMNSLLPVQYLQFSPVFPKFSPDAFSPALALPSPEARRCQSITCQSRAGCPSGFQKPAAWLAAQQVTATWSFALSPNSSTPASVALARVLVFKHHIGT